MKLLFKLIVLFFGFISCDKSGSNLDSGVLAVVSNSKLYQDDIKGLVSAGVSKKDSIIIVKDFIDRWASQKLLFDAAERNLTDEKQAELNKLVDQYKNDLYTKAYIEQLIFKSFDTLVIDEDIIEYYNKNKENFKTNVPLVKMSYIQINKNNPKSQLLSSKFANSSKINKAFLKENAIELKSYAFNDSIWIDMNQVYEKLPFITMDNKEKYLVTGKTIKYEDETDIYLVKTSNFIAKNQVTPLQYIKPTLQNVILNNRKTALINKFKKDITADALKDGTYQINTKK
ncbi:MAG TPA: hypothetical protein DDZ41_07980 [Flavobacterium sp.]|nr:hypothetical protein [Flavobacterium sp.]